MSFSDPIREWLRRLAGGAPAVERRMHGLPVTVINTRPDIDTAHVLARLDESLSLLRDHVPHHYRRLPRDFAGLLVQRYACRGAFFPEQRLCMVELTFTVNPDFTAAQVAATILHEAMHARLHTLGFPLEMDDRARQERFCRRAEIEFGRRVPGGEAIVARAGGALDGSDEEVAPVIDPRLAAERIAAVDAAALRRGGVTSDE